MEEKREEDQEPKNTDEYMDFSNEIIDNLNVLNGREMKFSELTEVENYEITSREYIRRKYDVEDPMILDVLMKHSKEGSQKLFIMSSMMKMNPTFAEYPILTPEQNLEELVNTLIDENYEHENTWTLYCDALFIARLFHAGFIPIATKIKFGAMFADKAGICEANLLLPKIHVIRSCMHPSEIHISKKVRKLCKHYTLTIDKDFTGVMQGIVEKHGGNWLFPFVQREFKKLFDRTVTYKNVEMHSIELWCEGELVAGEIGNTVGSIYTSLTGFQRKNSTGTIQLCTLAKLLEVQNFELWDLGMLLPYKKLIGSKEVSMKDFFIKHKKFKDKKAEFKIPGGANEINCASLIKDNANLHNNEI